MKYLLLILPFFTLAQNHKILYDYSWQRFRDSEIEAPKSFEHLIIVRDNSIWVLDNKKYYNDSLLYHINEDEKAGNITDPQAIFDGVMNKRRKGYILPKKYHITQNKVTAYQNILQDYYMWEREKPNFDWKVTSDTATVQGYLCQKATTHYGGRDFVAWFTYEIPISVGPWLFSGLPGLIVQVADSENHHHFSLNKINEFKNDFDINLMSFSVLEKDNIQLKNQKQFDQLYTDYKKNKLQFIEEQGVTIISGKEEIIKKSKRPLPDNPIELEESSN